jgi:hypothetical protein
MDSRAVTAARIDQMLRRELGHGIEAERLLADERYARDVLLVCDALRGTEAPGLARRFRSERPRPAPASVAPSGWSFDSAASGYGAALPAERSPARPWYSPSRWLAR